jgi:hypothetical protein
MGTCSMRSPSRAACSSSRSSYSNRSPHAENHVGVGGGEPVGDRLDVVGPVLAVAVGADDVAAGVPLAGVGEAGPQRETLAAVGRQGDDVRAVRAHRGEDGGVGGSATVVDHDDRVVSERAHQVDETGVGFVGGNEHDHGQPAT